VPYATIRHSVSEVANIAILGDGLVNWGGGIDLLRNLLNGICATPRQERSIFLLLPEEDWKYRTFLRLTQIRDGFIGLISKSGQRPSTRTRPTDIELKSTFAPYEDRVQVRFFDGTSRGLLASLREIRADVVFPCMTSLGKEFPVPWIGYLLDFQHRHMPNLFSWLEVRYRQRKYNGVLRDADTIVVNARAVKADALAFHAQTAATIVALPFAPSIRSQWLNTDPKETRDRYHLPANYFIICNQFWVHKDHKTAFRAFARFLASKSKGEESIHLVCTGGMHDYRAPAYVDEIKELLVDLKIAQNVHLLGHIAKEDQIALIRGSIAMIQPTLFEGGPGGGSIYDAVALGVPGLVSDIPVNREIDDPNIDYFAPGDSEGLAQLMILASGRSRPHFDNSALISRSNERLRRLGATLDDIFAAAVARRRG
jgi:glycosyltransferase involved in cell wall biosynthesis